MCTGEPRHDETPGPPGIIQAALRAGEEFVKSGGQLDERDGLIRLSGVGNSEALLGRVLISCPQANRRLEPQRG